MSRIVRLVRRDRGRSNCRLRVFRQKKQHVTDDFPAQQATAQMVLGTDQLQTGSTNLRSVAGQNAADIAGSAYRFKERLLPWEKRGAGIARVLDRGGRRH